MSDRDGGMEGRRDREWMDGGIEGRRDGIGWKRHGEEDTGDGVMNEWSDGGGWRGEERGDEGVRRRRKRKE